MPSLVIDLVVVGAVIVANGRILAAKRLPGGAASEKWEFPGGKLEAGETPEHALVREIQEELGLRITVNSRIGSFVTTVGDRRICLQCFWCRVLEGDLDLSAHSEVRWLHADELGALDWAGPDIPIVERILATGEGTAES